MKNTFRILIFIFFIILTVNVDGQERIIKEKKDGYITITQEVLKTDPSIFDGSYSRYFEVKKQKVLLESGAFQMGKKIGDWKYYYYNNLNLFNPISDNQSSNRNVENSNLMLIGKYVDDVRVDEWISYQRNGEIEQIYNYSTSQMVYFQPKKTPTNIIGQENPIFIGGYNYFNSLWIELSRTQKNKNDSEINNMFSFVINTSGKIENFKNKTNLNSKVILELLKKTANQEGQNFKPGLNKGLFSSYLCILVKKISKVKDKTNPNVIHSFAHYEFRFVCQN